MLGSRIHAYWLLVLVGVIIAVAGCETHAGTTLEEHSGTIYYANSSGIWKFELPGGQSSRLDEGLIDTYDLSPSEDWVAYTKYDFSGDQKVSSIWVVSTSSGSPVQVSHELPQAGMTWLESELLRYTECPDFYFADDGKPVGFESCTFYTFDPETGKHSPSSIIVEQQTPDETLRCGTAWSPGGYGDKAEWCLDETRAGFLRVVNLDGTNPITVAVPYRAGEAQWSDDGAKLAFTNPYPGGISNQLFVWDRLDGSVQHIMDLASCIGPSWSPDKKWIAFYTGDNDFCVVEVNTRNTKCFKGYISAVGPKLAWAPNSRAIVLSSNRIGQLLMGDTELAWDLFIVNIPDGNVTRVTDSMEVESHPVWGY